MELDDTTLPIPPFPTSQSRRAAKQTHQELCAAWRWPFAYQQATGNGRDLRLDFLRGLCLFVMVTDHASQMQADHDSWLFGLTGHDSFFISAMEGFVFISGFVIAMVYKRIIAKSGWSAALPKIIGRVVTLYWFTVGLTLFFSALAAFTHLALWDDRNVVLSKKPIEVIVGALTLHFSFHGSETLMMYIFFVAAAPLILYTMEKGRSWLVLLISALLWLTCVYQPDQVSLSFAIYFQLASVQALFVIGMVVNYHRETLERWAQGRRRSLMLAYQAGIVLVAALLIVFYRSANNGQLANWFPHTDFGPLLTAMTAKYTQTPTYARMLAVLIFIQAFYFLVTWVWKPLQWVFGWLLIPLGESSLYVFGMSCLVIVLFNNIPNVQRLPDPWYGCALIGTVVALWVMVKARFLFAIIPR